MVVIVLWTELAVAYWFSWLCCLIKKLWSLLGKLGNKLREKYLILRACDTPASLRSTPFKWLHDFWNNLWFLQQLRQIISQTGFPALFKIMDCFMSILQYSTVSWYPYISCLFYLPRSAYVYVTFTHWPGCVFFLWPKQPHDVLISSSDVLIPLPWEKSCLDGLFKIRLE